MCHNFMFIQKFQFHIPFCCEIILLTLSWGISLQDDGNRITWDRHLEPFTCVINAPEKKSKFKGMKSFIAYNITPSVS